RQFPDGVTVVLGAFPGATTRFVGVLLAQAVSMQVGLASLTCFGVSYQNLETKIVRLARLPQLLVQIELITGPIPQAQIIGRHSDNEMSAALARGDQAGGFRKTAISHVDHAFVLTEQLQAFASLDIVNQQLVKLLLKRIEAQMKAIIYALTARPINDRAVAD